MALQQSEEGKSAAVDGRYFLKIQDELSGRGMAQSRENAFPQGLDVLEVKRVREGKYCFPLNGLR
jgi:hypothetical protein